MAISDEDVARVRAATDTVAVMSEVVALKRVGRQWVGLCPFHAERTPSFSVNAEEGLYLCRGCQAKGDVITFVRETQHLDFVEAVEWLASKAGVHIEHSDTAASRDRERKSRLTDALAAAVSWYHERLLSSPDAGRARGYLKSRGIDGETARRFQIGWAPDDWDALARQLKLADSVLKESGLGFVNSRGRQQDFFRARVLFPIYDAPGKPVGFGGRILPDAEGSKYKNSGESPLYAKSRTLYALNWAKKAVVETGEVIVCEGYTDVIGFFSAGVPRAVATCGTALGEDHFRLLKNFARRVVLAFDADKAGQSAADRFYEWERKYDVEVAVAALPAGADPADLARQDPAALALAIDKAQPFLGFRVDRALASLSPRELREPEGRAKAAELALGVIAEHPNELVRTQYIGKVEGVTGIPFDQLQRSLVRAGRAAKGRGGAARPIEVRPPVAADDLPKVELQGLRVIVHDPAVVEHEWGIALPDLPDGVVDGLFADSRAQDVVRCVARHPSLSAAVEAADPDTADLLHRIVVEDVEAELDTLNLLCRRAARRLADELARGAPEDGEDREQLRHRSALSAWLREILESLEGDPTRLDAAHRLVAWLAWPLEEDG